MEVLAEESSTEAERHAALLQVRGSVSDSLTGSSSHTCSTCEKYFVGDGETT